MGAMIGFVFGVFCGTVLGIIMTAILVAGDKDDRP